MIRISACLLLLVAALGCVRPSAIDHSYRAKSQDSRAQFLILHFSLSWICQRTPTKGATEGGSFWESC